jgi:hypothetical protein
VQDVRNGWVEALRELGQHVIEFDLGERLAFYGSVHIDRDGEWRPATTPEGAYDLAVNSLYSTLYQAWPDVLLVISGFFIPPKLLDRAKRTRTRVVIVHTEAPYEDQRQLELAKWADINLINDPTNIEAFNEVAPTRYAPHAYRPSVHSPGPADPNLACDLGFVGTGFPSRVWFFEQMDLSGLDVILGGNWMSLPPESPLHKYVPHAIEECMDNDQAVQVYRSAKVGMNLYRREAERSELSAGWAMGPREVELAATGCFFLRDPRPESNDVFWMLPTFSSPEEASDLLRYWLPREAERERLAGLARAAIADRTFTTHAKSLLRLLDA